MNKCLILTKILLKTGTGSITGSMGNSKKKKRVTGQLPLYILIGVCFIPLIVMIYKLGGNMYDLMAPLGLLKLLFSVVAFILSLSTLILALPYVMSVMFFSTDLEYLLPLPLSSLQIAGAKFLTILVYEYYILFLMGVPLLLGIGIAANAGILYWISALTTLLLVPVLPVIYATLLGLLILPLIRRFKNKEALMTVFSLFIIVLAMVPSFLSSYFGDSLNLQMLLDILLHNRRFFTVADYLFPNLRFATDALAGSGITSLLLYIASSAAIVGIYLLLCSKLYLTQVTGLSESGEKRTALSRTAQEKALKSSGVVKTLALKEWKLLVRTPIYFLNCVIIVFLMPPLLIIPIGLSLFNELGASMLTELANAVSASVPASSLHPLVLLVVFGFAAVISDMNMVASTCISREGQNYYYMKYIPVSYKTQLRAKILCAVLLSLSSVLPYTILVVLGARYLFHTSLLLLLPSCIIGISTALFTAYIGLLFDLWRPKLVWINEQAAVKQNLIATLSMFVNMGLCFLLGALMVLLFSLKVPSTLLCVLGILLLAGLSALLRTLVCRYGEKRLTELEA